MSDPYGRNVLHHTDEEGLRHLLVGKSVTKVDDDQLELSDGTRLRLGGNTGGCACSAGDYELTELNECANVITNVEVSVEDDGSDRWEPDQTYRIFVFAENRKVNLAAFEGNDGNGYYGTGFWVEIVDGDHDE